MLKVSVNIPEGALKAVRKAVEAKVAQFAAQVASETYNNIIDNKKPYWSGEYLASWNVSFGTPKYIYLVSANIESGSASIHYPRPKPVSIIPNYSNPYQKIYISNAAGHAYKVENIGTATHPEGGWEHMITARNATLLKYRFF